MSNPFRLSLSIPPPRQRSGSASSLHLARSGGRSSAGSAYSDDDAPLLSGRRKSLSFTPITPTPKPSASTSPAGPTPAPAPGPVSPSLSARAPSTTGTGTAVDLLSPTPDRGSSDSAADTAAWAAQQERYTYDLERDQVQVRDSLELELDSLRESVELPRISASHARTRSRVQFADEACIEVFDPEDDNADEFEKPRGRELAAIVASFAVLVVLALAAGLTTIFDWVL